MKKYRYSPETITTIEGATIKSPFSGFVEVEIPSYTERMDILKSLNFSDKDGINVESGQKVIKLVEKHVVNVSLSFGESEKINSLEELGYYKEGTELINGISAIIVQGIPLGNSSKPL